jgi:hypothetical protein
MSDMSENYQLSGEDTVFILTALDALKEDLEEYLENEKTRNDALWHIALIKSVKQKLNDQEMQFTEDECRVMYIAALEMRDLMNKILDNKMSSEYDREMARSTLYSANAMLRVLRKTFIESGINIDDLV